MSPLWRKQKVTYNVPGHAHFLTYSCFQGLPLLSKDRSRQWVVDVLQQAREKFDFELQAAFHASRIVLSFLSNTIRRPECRARSAMMQATACW